MRPAANISFAFDWYGNKFLDSRKNSFPSTEIFIVDGVCSAINVLSFTVLKKLNRASSRQQDIFLRWLIFS